MGDVNLEIKLSNLDERVIKIEESDTPITVDSELSDTSTNPVQNKVITEALGTTDVSTTNLSNSAEGNIRSLHLYGKGEKTDNSLITSDGVVDSRTSNIIEGTDNWDGKWENTKYYSDDGYYKGLLVKKNTITWNGLYKSFNAKKGVTYTISAYIKTSINSAQIFCYKKSTENTKLGEIVIPNKDTWERISFSYTPSDDEYMGLRIESSNDENLSICGYMVSEDGNTEYQTYAHSTINASEILNSTFTGVNDIKDELIVNADGSGKWIKRVDKRAYQSGDENNGSYITDLTNTIYPIDTPIETDLTPSRVSALLSLKTFRDNTIITADCDYEIGYFLKNWQSVSDVDVKVDKNTKSIVALKSELSTLIETLNTKGVID